MVTLKEVAARAGVSPSTASGALRGLDFVRPNTAERVLKAAQELNYTANVSARALRSGRTGILSLAIPTVSIPFYSRLVSAMETCVERNGYQLVIQQTNFDEQMERRVLAQAEDTLSEGLFMLPARVSNREIAELTQGHPTVLFEDYSADITFDTVNAPSGNGIDKAIRHLAGRGRTHICVAGAAPVGGGRRHRTTSTGDAYVANRAVKNEQNSSRARYERIDAAIRALDELGLRGTSTMIDCNWGPDGGIELGHQLAALARSGTRYDGVCCMNDDIALGVLRGLADDGLRVPQDVAVTGFDGVPQGGWSVPTLTTIALDYEGMAATAVAMMLRKFGDSPVTLPQRVTAGFRLIERESTAIAA
ncbi:LacI family DNA-binding transcriptional regulator [Bifidobacterium sp. SO1]|uniref:LacI family DNA-binding transcriptional regulator n=1 Tax=Bifidobacterium sp. SO1 TaxID=2809029 RepID=UPI001BDD2D33|nr:LacI family DNA-binding transcriptional regulator [Bifidobacterium sp. SO1]MBT1161889.1 LacI family DNA-binding transcriptional regulator [Bifidobacterium sp. SO1]